MQLKQDKYTLGVAIARFQVPELTEAHVELVKSLINEHPRVLILLGLSPVRGTINNPLDFAPRKQMILEVFPPIRFPNLTVGYIKDVPDDAEWSRKVDELIDDHLGPSDTAVLYGGRDSFIPHYKGRLKTRELMATRYISGTEIRDKVSKAPQSDPMFRMGAIWATYQRWATAYPTVDVAVIRDDQQLLLARKAGETGYRFVGGFVAPSDESYEAAALRELYEETSLTVGLDNLKYVGSLKVNDWRYANERDKIITHLYVGRYIYGMPVAGDDIAEVRWFALDKLCESDIVDTHLPLYKKLCNYLSATKA